MHLGQVMSLTAKYCRALVRSPASSRQAALALVPVMAVAAWVHLPNGWVHTSTGGGWEYPAFLIAASVALWLLGDGTAAMKRSLLLVPRLRSA